MTGFLSVIPATLTLISSAGFGVGLTSWPPSMRLSFTAYGNGLPHTGRALQLVPGKAAPFHGALERLEEYQGEQLAVGEALQPDVAQQEEVAFSARLLPLEREGNGRSDEIDHHEQREVHYQAMKAGRVRRFGMEIFADEVRRRSYDKHDVNKRRDQRQQDLEDDHVGYRCPAQRSLLLYRGPVLPYRLHDAEGPAEALPHQPARLGWRLGIGQRAVLVIHPIACLEKRHGEIGIFGDGVVMITTGGANRSGAPGANGARNHAHGVERVQRAPLEVLAGDVL